MLIIFIRAVILFTVLLVVVRLMGKRQIGEMEPFELVITLVIAELACIPMSDRSIPITFGVVAILTMFLIHQVIVLLSKNNDMQKVISGKPVMVIDKQGINLYALKQLNLQVNDLLQAIRGVGYFSIEEIDFGLMETNGQLSVVPKKDMENRQQTLPVPIILDKKWDEENLGKYGLDKQKVLEIMSKHRLKLTTVAMLTVDQHNRIVIQPTNRAFFAYNYEGEKLLKS